ncbi:hypothetical protein [Corynebacterium sp. H113]|uniref:hypothetical protein n=1 Tax=Corynebacterium sp. H113 TaxID=3133419 RepID=UPI003099D1DE
MATPVDMPGALAATPAPPDPFQLEEARLEELKVQTYRVYQTFVKKGVTPEAAVELTDIVLDRFDCGVRP